MPRSNNPIFFWDLTIPAKNVTKEELFDWLSQSSKQWAFQLEEGSTGYRHWQIRTNLKEKTRVPPTPCEQAHYTPTQTSTVEGKKAFSYVMKDEGRIDGPWTDKDQIYVPPRISNLTELFPWQSQAMEKLRSQNDRQILWIYENVGNVGKSIFIDYLICREQAIFVPPACDTEQQMGGYIYSRVHLRPAKQWIIVVDLPRSTSKGAFKKLMGCIEQTKSGRAFDGRNTARMALFRRPKVVVCSNYPPQRKYQSNDRWDVMEVHHGSDPTSIEP